MWIIYVGRGSSSDDIISQSQTHRPSFRHHLAISDPTHHITLKRRPIPRAQHLSNLPVPTSLSFMPRPSDVEFARHCLRRQTFIEATLEALFFVFSRSEVISRSVGAKGRSARFLFALPPPNALQLEKGVGDLQHENMWMSVVLVIDESAKDDGIASGAAERGSLA